uniref:Nucleotide-diphospho-sugar transferase domain-containing protein n=1 Tax=viral metagenome TaxID=1070528 RepID=A0A6C0LJ53_9ZZZZ
MYSVYKRLEDFLKNNGDANINFCVANNGILEMTRNLVKSAQMNNVKIVLIALDKTIVRNMRGQCDIVKYFDNHFEKKIVSAQFYSYDSKDFKLVVHQRFFIGNQILKANKSYIYMDVDIVITKNFVNDVLKQYENTEYDCLIQSNGNKCCTGFYSMRPTVKTLSIDKPFFEKYDYKKYKHDQAFFNRKIYVPGILNIKLLNRPHYPTGSFYYTHSSKIEDKCFIVHFNCLIGNNIKINKMKAYKKWYIN